MESYWWLITLLCAILTALIFAAIIKFLLGAKSSFLSLTIKISVIIILFIALATGLVVSCSPSKEYKSKYDRDLENGLDKLYNGETMTEDEEEAVNDFYEWNDEQYRNK